jgi:hypothetical protein
MEIILKQSEKIKDEGSQNPAKTGYDAFAEANHTENNINLLKKCYFRDIDDHILTD